MKDGCGIVLIRLKKPLAYFAERYGSALYGLSRLFLLMEKQHNRGQDGAGIGSVKLDVPAGEPYLFRKREHRDNPIARLFQPLFDAYSRRCSEGLAEPVERLKRELPFAAEIYLGHVRYGTSGGYGLRPLHPYLKKSTWPSRNLMLAGNSNLTNVDELRAQLTSTGQHPVFATDTQALLEVVGHYLDQEHERSLEELGAHERGRTNTRSALQPELDLPKVLRQVFAGVDGGYALVGALGDGTCFALRDPLGIRPAFWLETQELLAVASERPPLQTVFGVEQTQVRELMPGHVLIADREAGIMLRQVCYAARSAACSFERIYLSRGNDADTYRERKALGAALCDSVLESVERDLARTVFGYVPNTAELAYLGLLEELRRRRRSWIAEAIVAAARRQPLRQPLVEALLEQNPVRAEKVAHKDAKLRTFIAREGQRAELSSHVYDVSYGSLQPGDNLVIVDDSIVRGTTLQASILRILSRLGPRRIVVASTAPQLRYPDCYGIDMADLGDLIAFRATMDLLEEDGCQDVVQRVLERCRAQLSGNAREPRNEVRALYERYSPERISRRIAELVRPRDVDWPGELVIVFQSIEGLRRALPKHQGDWYFTGHYPTLGGQRVVNQAFVNYMENRPGRSYR